MRVLVCGGRDYADFQRLSDVLYGLLRDRVITTIISGHARGADQLAEAWAREASVDCVVFPANWDKFGRSAGAIRNRQMLTEGKPDLVVAFPGGAGTANMVKQATKAGVGVMEIK